MRCFVVEAFLSDKSVANDRLNSTKLKENVTALLKYLYFHVVLKKKNCFPVPLQRRTVNNCGICVIFGEASYVRTRAHNSRTSSFYVPKRVGEIYSHARGTSNSWIDEKTNSVTLKPRVHPTGLHSVVTLVRYASFLLSFSLFLVSPFFIRRKRNTPDRKFPIWILTSGFLFSSRHNVRR